MISVARRGLACPACARPGEARPGTAGRGLAGLGLASLGSLPSSMAGHVRSGQRKAWLAEARQGSPSSPVSSPLGMAWHASARHGGAGQGWHNSFAAGHGRARCGAARQALAWRGSAGLGSIAPEGFVPFGGTIDAGRRGLGCHRSPVAGLGLSRPGMADLVVARPGTSRRGPAWPVPARQGSEIAHRLAWRVRPRPGKASRGKAALVLARPGKAGSR